MRASARARGRGAAPPARAAIPPAAVLLLLLAAAAAPRRAAAQCTTILVASGATSDGSLIMARTADAGEAIKPAGLLRHEPPRRATTFKSNVNGFKLDLPPDALGYTASPSWFSRAPGAHNPSFECCGVNDAGVSMSGTETILGSDAALAADPLDEAAGIGEDAIVSVLLPVARSARAGAAALGALIGERRASEGYGVSFMDSKEIWYLEAATGTRWLAQRVPDDSYFIAANQGRFGPVPPGALAPPDLAASAFAAGLCNASAPFSFFGCYMRNLPDDVNFYNRPRVARLQYLYSKNQGPDYPVFLKPHKKLTLWDVIRGLRDHYQGTPGEPYFAQNPGGPWRPVSLLRTQVAHVSVQRPPGAGLPEELAFVEWLAWGMPTLSPFMPLYLRALPRISPRLASPSIKPDDTSLYWIMRRLQAVVFQDFPKLAPEAIAVISGLERAAAAAARQMEKRYKAALATENPYAASELVQAFTDATAEAYAAAISALTRDLAARAGLGKLDDDQIVDMLVKAEALYHFHLPEGEGPGAGGGAGGGGSGGAEPPGAGRIRAAAAAGGDGEEEGGRPQPS
ncbi:MAG: pathogenicity island-encoded protein D [Monoraphidium minutum]|nr:MAG: pathogenicity island-encoded protein D [Monoraphidium minutum]